MSSRNKSEIALNGIGHHKKDLKEAIYYLPENFDFKLLCQCLKHVYGDRKGKELSREWALKTKNAIPNDFEDYWKQLKLTSYRRQRFDAFISKKLYSVAKNIGWIPKAVRKGKQSKKPPSKKAIKEQEKKIDADKKFEQKLKQAKERNLEPNQKSFIPPSIVNKSGACYFHPYMKKSEIPDDRSDYLSQLTKIVDCEVKVIEAIEYIIERNGRQTDDVQVRYKLELNNRNDKRVYAEVDHENITTRTRFSSFLVSKGFVKFIGDTRQFNMFHKFLINEQEYPTIKRKSSWGEFKPGLFLFENGLYDIKKSHFFSADNKLRIAYKDKHLTCPSGSKQVRPPRLSLPKSDTQKFLQDTLLLWEEFNGSLNVRTTMGYAVATAFSRLIKEEYDAFPLLFKYGERGTGKSTSMDWFMALFGYRNGNRQSVSKQNTLKGINRRMTLPAYFPFFLDDYRNHETNSNAPNLTSSILNWFHQIGTGMAKKSTDNQTIDTPMRAAVVMTGNDKPTDPAVLDRMIILNYTNFLKKEQQQKVKRIADNTHRLSEFMALVLENYPQIKGDLFRHIEDNRGWLAEQGFNGRTSLIWSIVLSGYQCLPHILPGLTTWHNDFEALRSEICQKIQKEQSLQNEQIPLHVFFEALDYFSTLKKDPDNKNNYLMDHRHFRVKEEEAVQDHNGQVIYEGPVLAIHMPRIWNSLQSVRAHVIQQYHKTNIQSMLENSNYYLAKSQQVILSKDTEASEKSNLRCYYLSVQELAKRGLLEEVIEKGREYEQNRKAR